jgi:hypothetical protein
VAYATVDELADALRLAVTAKNSDRLASCLDAAADEIDHALGRPADALPFVPPYPPLLRQVNIARGLEWFKASDAAFGVLGFADVGALNIKLDGFARHARALTPHIESFGLA